MTVEERQLETAQMFAKYIESTNPAAIGVAMMFFECGCSQGGPFDDDGNQIAVITHLGQTIEGEVRICEECLNDGGAVERVTKSALVFFRPHQVTEEQRARISEKIFSDSITSSSALS
jgi:hypothetical protein